MTIRLIGGPSDGHLCRIDYDVPRISIPVEIARGHWEQIEYQRDNLYAQSLEYANSPRHYRFMKWTAMSATDAQI
jgi:hypothetical protein